jgi:hypothetical protein
LWLKPLMLLWSIGLAWVHGSRLVCRENLSREDVLPALPSTETASSTSHNIILETTIPRSSAPMNPGIALAPTPTIKLPTGGGEMGAYAPAAIGGSKIVHLNSVTLTALPEHEPLVSDCTSTMLVTPSRVCTWDDIETVHTSTTTSHYKVDCHGCQSVVVNMEDLPCPTRLTVGTITTSVPYTQWDTICSESGPIPTAESSVTSLLPRAGETCSTTLAINPPQAAGRVSTVYQVTATETMFLNCSGCSLVLSTQVQGFGPLGSFTRTSTASKCTTITYICA